MRLAPLLLSIPFTLMAVGHAAADSPPLSILWPVSTPKTDQNARRTVNADSDAVRQRITENQLPDYVLRTGTVMLDTPALVAENAAMFASDMRTRSASHTQSAPRQRLRLDLFSDMQIDLEITSEKAPAPGVRAINGRELNHEFATFSMTLTPESYLITFADPDSSMLYRIVGDSATGYGKITQIDQALMPPVIHLPPRISGKPQ